MARERKEESKGGGSPGWMTTYGDMVTLILTFFVLLFSFSTIDAEIWDQIVQVFSGVRFVVIEPLDPSTAMEGFDMPTPRPTPTPSMNPDELAQQIAFDELYERIQGTIETNNLGNILGLDKTDDSILMRVKDSALFDSGRAEIKPEAMEILRLVSLIFDEYETNIGGIRVEGHTDNVPIENATFPSNWELSGARAGSVLQFFRANSIIPENKYSMAGYGEFRPIATNGTEEGKAQNRRVDFIIQSIVYSEEGGLL